MFHHELPAWASSQGAIRSSAHYCIKRPDRTFFTVLLCVCLIAACGSDNSTDSSTTPDENVDTETPVIPPTPVTPQNPDIPPTPVTPQNPDIPPIPAPPVIPPAPDPTDGTQMPQTLGLPSPSLTTRPSPASELQPEPTNHSRQRTQRP